LEVFILSELAEVANFARCWWVVATFGQISSSRRHSEQSPEKEKAGEVSRRPSVVFYKRIIPNKLRHFKLSLEEVLLAHQNVLWN
jgi:hypothetical protein